MRFCHTMVVGLTAFTFFAGAVQTCRAEQARAAGEQSAVSELLRLLESKGVLSKEEAGALEKKFTGTPGMTTGAGKSESAAPASGVGKPTGTAFSYEEVRETLATLKEDGVISTGEVVELEQRTEMIRRAGRGEYVPERQPLRIGVVPVDSQIGFIQVEEVRDRLRFLAYQKVMTREEAALVYRRFGDNYTSVETAQKKAPLIAAEGKPTEQTVVEAGSAGGGTSIAGVKIAENVVAPFAYGEVVETVDSLNDQGVISDDEMEELKGRVEVRKKQNAGDKSPERQVRPVGKGMIPYRRTTVGVEEVQDSLKFLAYQKIMSPREASDLYARFSRKYPTDQLAENISDELAWEVRYQVAQKMDSVSDLERKNARLPEWLERFKLFGDLRLRFEGDYYASDNALFRNPSDPAVLLNSQHDQDLFKLRARLGLLAKVSDDVDAGLRLATGTTNNPVSTNVTLGDFFNKKSITLDQGYLKWKPLSSLTLWGGIFPNPWFSTDMVWDGDINFDGFAVQYNPRLSDCWGLFTTAGAFPLQFVDQHQKWLFGGQVGANYKYDRKLNAKLGVAFYDFVNTVGVVNDNPAMPGATDWSAPLFQQKGNTLMDIDPDQSTVTTAFASAFRELNVTGTLDLGYWDPTHVMFTADYVYNFGFDQNAVNSRAAEAGQHVKKEVQGFQVGVTIGHPVVQAFLDWKAWLFYKYLESDAVIDSFTDSDFHLGGTNAKGWILGAEFGLTKNVWLTSRWLSANEISGPPFGIDVFQFDLNAKF